MQRYFGKEKVENTFLLHDDDFFHIKTVMRMKENDQIEVVYEKELYICSLSFVEENILVTIEEKQEQIITTKEINLLIPLLKEAKMDLILQKGTELGVSKFIPYIAERSIIKWDEKKETKKLERWNRICKEASEQSKRLDIPYVSRVHTLTEISSLEGLSILCSTKEKKRTLKNLLQSSPLCDKMNVIVGPEGGFSSREEEYLIKSGFIGVTLGERIMRVETVPLFLMSAIGYEYME